MVKEMLGEVVVVDSMTDFFDKWKKVAEKPLPKISYGSKTSIRIVKKIPSKKQGRVGTRRNWKRKNPPILLYRVTPVSILVNDYFKETAESTTLGYAVDYTYQFQKS